MRKTQPMTICLWYDNEAEQAVNLYTGIFKDSSVGRISRYGKEGFEYHQKPEGTVMTIEFALNGMHFLALNGGPQFKFNEAASVVVQCEAQEEIDYYWDRLSEGGEEGPCGWLKDRYGLSWQIVPEILNKYMTDNDSSRVARVTETYLQMKKFDIARLQKAYEGK